MGNYSLPEVICPLKNKGTIVVFSMKNTTKIMQKKARTA